jgi:hypothetical protein
MARTRVLVHSSTPGRPASTPAVFRQRRVDFRHEPVAALDQQEADFVALDVLVERRDAIYEGRQLAE